MRSRSGPPSAAASPSLTQPVLCVVFPPAEQCSVAAHGSHESDVPTIQRGRLSGDARLLCPAHLHPSRPIRGSALSQESLKKKNFRWDEMGE